MIRFVILALLCALSTVVSAKTGSIRIFHTDADPVLSDMDIPKNINVVVHNMDDHDRVYEKLTLAIRAKVPEGVTAENAMEEHTKAFFELMETPAWQPFNDEMKASAINVEKALRYKIQSLPAIVFNDKYVIYGVSSIREALRIYGVKSK